MVGKGRVTLTEAAQAQLQGFLCLFLMGWLDYRYLGRTMEKG